MRELFQRLFEVERTRLIIYILFYMLWGFGMNYLGQELEIAKFVYWWQVFTIYVLYMVPISILLRPYSFFTQYCYSLLAMGIIEFGGYTLGSSYIYPNNFLDRMFDPHVFALGMTLFFALYFPIGNWVVNRIFTTFHRKK